MAIRGGFQGNLALVTPVMESRFTNSASSDSRSPSVPAGRWGWTLYRTSALLSRTRISTESSSSPHVAINGSCVVCGVSTGMISTHFASFAIERGVSPGTAALIFGLMLGLNALGGIRAGVLSDRFGRKNVLAVVYLLRGVAFVLLVSVPASMGMWA